MAIVFTPASPTPVEPRDVRLHVSTVGVDLHGPLAERIPAEASGVWLNGEDGLVGVGIATRVSAKGESRILELRDALSTLAKGARVENLVEVPSGGLIAFASMSYSASSPRDSVLVIPRLILGRHNGRTFLTTITLEDEERPATEDALAQFSPASSVDFALGPMRSAHSPASYQGLVKDAIDAIDDSIASKIVLSERFTVNTHRASPRQIIPSLARELHCRYPSAWTFFVGDVVGASPEMLTRVSGGTLFSRVLAGTRPLTGEADLDAEAFLADPKEASEHHFAARSVIEPLEAAGLRPTQQGPFVLELPGIAHVASDIHAPLPGTLGVLDIASMLHPSAAVSGTPKRVADRYIDALERVDRGGYASPVGWVSASGDGEMAIALRMAHVGESEFVIQAGGGIVSASDPLTEHAEVLAKTRPVAGALAALAHDQAAESAVEF